MEKTLICNIRATDQNYPIWIESGVLLSGKWIQQIKTLAHRFVILCDDHVTSNHGNSVLELMKKEGIQVDLFSFPAGESHKNRETKEALENQMLNARCGRDTALIALGGGVTTDLGGFIASTFNRGIPLIMIPTSLLAMVDASIGGKNGIDVPQGKNLIGTIYQPKLVLVDPSVLKTLPERELRNGVVEMIKHALIADSDYFKFFQTHAKLFLSQDPKTMEKAIYDSCLIKKRIVEEDEKETGKRRLLNSGHTLAHAIESLSHYKIAHGEAVAIGIVIEAFISNKLGYLPSEELEQILDIFHTYGVPLHPLHTITPNDILNAVVLDKKSVKGKARYVLLKKIGVPMEYEGQFCTQIDDHVLNESLTWYAHVMCHH